MQDTLLNLIPGACSPEVHLSQYDKGRVVPFKLANGKSAYDVPAGSVIVVKATKPSGLGFIVPVSFEGDTATMTITETMSNEYGRFPAELSITNGDTLIGTANFVLNVEKSPHPEGTTDGDAETLIPELTLLVNEIRESNAKVESMTASAESLPAGSEPTANYDPDTNNLALGIPSGEKGDKGDKGDTGAKGDKGDKGDTGDVSLAQLEEILSDYALQNGYYDEFTAGSAEQLLSSQFVEDSVPYKFRTSGGSADIGNREYDEIVGGSIVWNQLLQARNLVSNYSKFGLTMTQISGKFAYHISGTFTAENDKNVYFFNASPNIAIISGHVYLASCTSKYANPYCYGATFTGNCTSVVGGSVVKATNSANLNISLNYGSGLADGTAIDEDVFVNFFDLTQMFGSQVADYIYSLEQAQSGKGVAFFKSLFPNDYYPYNAGELMSVEGLQSHDTVGFNQWDEEWEVGAINGNTGQPSANNNYIRSKNYSAVLPNTTYYVKAPTTASNISIFFYDADKSFISVAYALNSTFTTPNGARYFKIMPLGSYGNTYKNDICINLSWSGWRNGEYEPYKKHSYALDSSLTLRGIPKIVDNKFCFDGDIYSYDGNVNRMLSAVVLNGSEEWSWSAGNAVGITRVNGLKIIDATSQSYQLTFNSNSKLADIPWSKRLTVDGSLGIYFGNPYIYVKLSSITSAEDAKAFFTSNPTTVIYALQTPTEETATPFDEIQLVDDFGTEEYVSGNLVPVGHNTKYPANLRDKLQHLPNLADNDGYYMISQQNKHMSLELFRIPKAPTTDGVYTLKAHVSGGTPLYVWEAEE